MFTITIKDDKGHKEVLEADKYLLLVSAGESFTTNHSKLSLNEILGTLALARLQTEQEFIKANYGNGKF